MIWLMIGALQAMAALQAGESPDPAAWLVLGLRAMMLALVLGFGAATLWLALGLPRIKAYQSDAGGAEDAWPRPSRPSRLRRASAAGLSDSVRRWRLIAGSLSVGTALIHGLVIPEHFEEWWGYGVFFVLASLAQGLYGLVLMDIIALPSPWWRLDRIASGSNGHHGAFYTAGIVGNLAVIGLYLVTRTVGIPVFGPEAGVVESVTAISLASKFMEGALVVVLWPLRRAAGH